MQKTILSTSDVARLFNVTETTVKRWADEGALKCQKTPGGHRKFVIRYVIEFAEKNNMEPLGVLQMPVSGESASRLQLAILERDLNALVHAFLDRALSPDQADLPGFLSYLYEHKIPLWQIYDEVIRGGMQEIGMRWERGEVGIDQEHKASYATLEALARLQAQIHVRQPNGHAAVLACVGDELHEMGLRCASYLFEAEGWQTHYLGARTPVAAIVRAVREIRPSAVCISTSLDDQAVSAGPHLREVAAVARELGAVSILGGRASRGRGVYQKAFDAVVTSSKELADLLEHFPGGKPAGSKPAGG